MKVMLFTLVSVPRPKGNKEVHKIGRWLRNVKTKRGGSLRPAVEPDPGDKMEVLSVYTSQVGNDDGFR